MAITSMRFWVRRIITSIINRCLDFSVGLLVSSHPEWNPRSWSNREIKRIGKLFTGDVVNISAEMDSDKGGDVYSNYFPNARSYTITNYKKNNKNFLNEKVLDLSVPYNGSIGYYDLVFNHTVIEHIFESSVAIDNLCKLSHDCVLTIVPFIQCLHWREGIYRDYWRYSPFALQEEFRIRGFKTLYMTWNQNTPLMNVYIFHLASKNPERYTNIFPKITKPEFLKYAPGMAFQNALWPSDEYKTLFKRFGDKVGEFLSQK